VNASRFVMAGTRPGMTRFTLGSQEQLLPRRIEIDSLPEIFMGRYLLLWLLGVPLPILVLIYAFGGLH
jgi:hypothetical protein